MRKMIEKEREGEREMTKMIEINNVLSTEKWIVLDSI